MTITPDHIRHLAGFLNSGIDAVLVRDSSVEIGARSTLAPHLSHDDPAIVYDLVRLVEAYALETPADLTDSDAEQCAAALTRDLAQR